MMDLIDKRERSEKFRQRLRHAMDQAQMSQSQLARSIGVDRSTISQLLKGHHVRLPNAHVVGACASALGVSADWLLTLSDKPQTAGDIMSSSMTLTTAPRAPVDDRIDDWYREAEGHKIRHVPAGLPDLLKTRDMLEWEYAPHLSRTVEQAIVASERRLEFIQSAQSDLEIAIPTYEIRSFVAGTGHYHGLPVSIRRRQLAQFLKFCEQLYPRLRIYLFDAQRLYSAPITIFGPLLSVFYVGTYYLVFRDKERINHFTQHFDGLIREADIAARDVSDFLKSMENEYNLKTD